MGTYWLGRDSTPDDAWALAGRTNQDGEDQGKDADPPGPGHTSAAAARMLLTAYQPGVVTPNVGFRVQQLSAPGLGVAINGGAAGTTEATMIAPSTELGQGSYLVGILGGLDVSMAALGVPPPDNAQARTDSIYLVVRDVAYDSNVGDLVLWDIAWRDGTPGVGAAPGPDPAWTAAVHLADVAVGIGVTELVNANITDRRQMTQPKILGGLTVPGLLTAGSVDIPNLADHIRFDGQTLTGPLTLASNPSWTSLGTVVFTRPAGWTSYRIGALAVVTCDSKVLNSLRTQMTIGGTSQAGDTATSGGSNEPGPVTVACWHVRQGLTAGSLNLVPRGGRGTLSAGQLDLASVTVAYVAVRQS